MLKVGDLVRYSWTEEVGIVLEVDRNKDEIMAKIKWSERFARKNNTKSNIWWTKVDRWLQKVGK
jgi:hypothetical protein